MVTIAIDPGTRESAVCIYDGVNIAGSIVSNEAVVKFLEDEDQENKILVIEMVASYGMPVGAEVFETCVWIGRFIQAWREKYELVYRKDVKLHLCQSMRATDASIRQELINRLGKPGTKKKPGRTYGLKRDMWQALAVAITYREKIAGL